MPCRRSATRNGVPARVFADSASGLCGQVERLQLRHDLVGIRLAQIALGFGVDTFAGPLQSDRKLPLAGVTRPDEATREGIATLVRAAGLRPVFDPSENRAATGKQGLSSTR